MKLEQPYSLFKEDLPVLKPSDEFSKMPHTESDYHLSYSYILNGQPVHKHILDFKADGMLFSFQDPTSKFLRVGPLNSAEYRNTVRDELLNKYRDRHGYIIDYENGKAATLGEATLHTAIAAVAIATGNYRQDSWEATEANARLKELLNTLLHHSWGNRDNLRRKHPIRHPDKHEFDINGKFLRISPLSKDSFGAIISAAYYAYSCPNSDSDVRTAAHELMTKWTEYLVLFQWRTHSTYFVDEFESVGRGEKCENKKCYKNIYNEKGKQDSYKGIESFMLWPHELYALQNVAARMGIPTTHWNIWLNGMGAELKQMVTDYAAPYIADAAGRGLDFILRHLAFAIPYNIQLGPDDWSWGKFEGIFAVRIPSETRERIVESFKITIRDLIRESIRLDNYATQQAGELLGLAVNRILNLLPDTLAPDSWRSVLTGALQQVVPWMSSSAWVETATFLVTLQVLKNKDMTPANISYTVWSFDAECETRPEMAEILLPAIQEFFSFLRGKGNPNGLWAWLSGDSGRVHEQLRLFESKPPSHWWKFAYGEVEFNDWVMEPDTNPIKGKESPRLDYLVLDGLAEKGPPLGAIDIIFDWLEKFKNFVQDAALQYLESIKKQFAEFGRYTRQTLNQAGVLIRETWTNTLEYTKEQLQQGELVLKQTWNKVGNLMLQFTRQLDGIWVEEYWNRTNEKYWKGVWSDASGAVDKMIKRIIHGTDGSWSEEFWNRANEKYWKGIWSDASGAADKMIKRIIHGTDDSWSEEFWNRANEKYWKGVWSDASGAADKMIKRIIHGMDDSWSEEFWNQANEKYWKGVWSDASGAADKMRERYIRKWDDQVTVEVWNEAGEWGRSVFNAVGDLIERVGSLAMGRLPHWWPPRPDFPF